MLKRYSVILSDYELHTLSFALSNQLQTDQCFLKEHDPFRFADVERRRKCIGRLIYLFDRCGQSV